MLINHCTKSHRIAKLCVVLATTVDLSGKYSNVFLEEGEEEEGVEEEGEEGVEQ